MRNVLRHCFWISKPTGKLVFDLVLHGSCLEPGVFIVFRSCDVRHNCFSYIPEPLHSHAHHIFAHNRIFVFLASLERFRTIHDTRRYDSEFLPLVEGWNIARLFSVAVLNDLRSQSFRSHSSPDALCRAWRFRSCGRKPSPSAGQEDGGHARCH